MGLSVDEACLPHLPVNAFLCKQFTKAKFKLHKYNLAMSIVLYHIACNMLSVHLLLTYWHWYADTVYYVCICCRYTGVIFV